MAYDHAEQEQLDSFKAWWQRFGSFVSIIIIVALVAFAGWKGWGIYQNKQSMQASQLFEEQTEALTAKDNARVLRVADDMQSKFAGTPYAVMASLTAAKDAVDANKADVAKKYLSWVLNNGKGAEYKAIAAARLSGILMDEKSYDEALKVLSGSFPAQFASLIADRRGDVLLAQGKRDEARAAYTDALAKAQNDDPAKSLIQLKLDSVGSAA